MGPEAEAASHFAGLCDADVVARYDKRLPRYTSYPTAPQFSARVGPTEYRAWLAALPLDATLSLYLHIPFCRELCFYCGCHTTVARRYSPVAAYVDSLLREIAIVGQIIGEGRRVTHVHWGGGTPNILSPRHLLEITKTIRRRFEVVADSEIAVEIDPRTLSRPQVEALVAMGVNRVSLGVQDVEETVQRTINRVQPFEVTERAVEWLREAGITAVNLDLMYGLPHQTVASVARSTATVLALAPSRVAVFGYAHVPWMKRHQALIPEALLPGPLERLEQMRAASATLTGAGYAAIGLDHFAAPDDPLAAAQRTGRLHRNFQGYTTDEATALIGFGTSSISRLPEGFVQNLSRTLDYNEAVDADRPATARGIAVTPDDRLRGAIIERLMCDLAVDLEAVAIEHRIDPLFFRPELAVIEPLTADGLVKRDGFRLEVPSAARPLVRAVCAVFDRYLASETGRYSRAV